MVLVRMCVIVFVPRCIDGGVGGQVWCCSVGVCVSVCVCRCVCVGVCVYCCWCRKHECMHVYMHAACVHARQRFQFHLLTFCDITHTHTCTHTHTPYHTLSMRYSLSSRVKQLEKEQRRTPVPLETPSPRGPIGFSRFNIQSPSTHSGGGGTLGAPRVLDGNFNVNHGNGRVTSAGANFRERGGGGGHDCDYVANRIPSLSPRKTFSANRMPSLPPPPPLLNDRLASAPAVLHEMPDSAGSPRRAHPVTWNYTDILHAIVCTNTCMFTYVYTYIHRP